MAVTLQESKMMKDKERISCTDSFVSSFFYYWALRWPISANLMGLNFNSGFFFFISKAIILQYNFLYSIYIILSENCRQRELN